MGNSSSSTSSAEGGTSGGFADGEAAAETGDRDGFFDDAAAEESAAGPEGRPAGADQWAKAVVDGVHDDGEIVDAEIVEDDEAGDSDEAGNGDEAGTGSEPEVEIIDVAPADTADADGAAPDADVAAAAAGGARGPAGDISVEDLVADLERVTVERDQYLDASRRIQAEFENFKKQSLKREGEARERANDSLIGEMLPVLDAFDGAVANGAEDVAPMRASFIDALVKLGLERIDPTEQPFDPNLHEAVMHEDASDTDGPVVTEVMRAGYTWKGRVLRPAMVRTRG